jgi:adenylate cyclase, class 2
MVEIEKKYRLTEERRDEILTVLEEVGAVYDGEDFEENTIYGGGRLENNRGVVRIRKTQDRSLLTFKRRMENAADVKQQLEYETEVSDVDAAVNIIRELDMKPQLVYEKRRKIWRLGDVEIVVDELPFGLFMEIEGSITGIKEAEILLEIDDLETENETYPMLTARLGKLTGDRTEARFS